MLQALSIRRHAVARESSIPLIATVYAQCALGTLVATGCELDELAVRLPQHLAFTVLLIAAALLFRVARFSTVSLGAAAILAGAWICAQSSASLVVLYLATLTLNLVQYGIGPRRVPLKDWLARLVFGLNHGALPFLAGYIATGHHPRTSALLLAIGFFGVCTGLWPYLRANLVEANVTTPFRWAHSWIFLAPLGLAAILAWLSMYGPYPSGIFLASPGVLWILFLVSGRWFAVPGNPPRQTQLQTQAFLAWVALVASIAVACAL